ncbi:MAG: hypothetical protein AAGA99_17290 [Actinomycetota bacterium]
MARENSAKKVAKVASSGRSRSARPQRRLGFPALVAGVVVVGSLLVFVARGERESTAGERPLLNVATASGGIQGDHWHAAYGVFDCTVGESGSFLPPFVDDGADQTGIHTHADGFIHIHPFSSRARGSRATLEVFFDQVALDAGDDEWELPGGEVRANGDECADGSEGEWRVAKWDAVDDPEPEIFEGGFDRIRFRDDGEVYTFFFGPDDAEILQPGSVNDTVDDLAPVVDDDGNIISPDDLDQAFTDSGDDDSGDEDAPAEDEAPAETTTPAEDEAPADTTAPSDE